MTDGGLKAIKVRFRNREISVSVLIAASGMILLIIGIILGSPVGRVVCTVLLVGAGTLMWYRWRTGKREFFGGSTHTQEELYSQSPDGPMKKLLFDDFQTGGAHYVVKEIKEETAVVPSTKSIHTVPTTASSVSPKEFSISDFFDLDSDIFHADSEPKGEFHFLLNKVLLALKEVMFAYSAAYFWSNREKGQMVLEAMATDSQKFMGTKRFAIGSDIVSQVAVTGKPQLLGRVNPVSERELLRYYETPEGVSSLVVVPVYFVKTSQEQLPVGVIVADSKAEDAFGLETLGLLGHFTKLISALIKSYTDKYDLLLDAELLTSIRRLQDRIKSDPSEYTVLNALGEESNRLINWDCLSVTMFSEERNGWVLQKVVNKLGGPYVAPDQLVDFNESIVGSVIKTNKLVVVDNLSVERPVRYYPDERIDSLGSFLCVPISSLNRCYGALTLESKNKANFAGIEVETVYRLVENAAAALEVLYMNEMIKDFVVVDHETGSFTKKHFMKRLEEEVQRADDSGADLALVSLAIDAMKEHTDRYGKEGSDSILNHVTRIVRGNIRPYDIVGRQEIDTIGVLLVNTAASDAYLWAEKIRKQIASYVLVVSGKSISVTVSAGVCGLSEGMRKDELVEGTSQVLHRAIEGGGNLVQVF